MDDLSARKEEAERARKAGDQAREASEHALAVSDRARELSDQRVLRLAARLRELGVDPDDV